MKTPRLLKALAAAALLAAAGCYTEPPPPPADAPVDSRLRANNEQAAERPNRMEPQELRAFELALKYRLTYIRSIPGIGAVADMAVIVDMIGSSIENTDDIERLLLSCGEFFQFVDPPPGICPSTYPRDHMGAPDKSIVNEAVAEGGIRGLYIHCAEERLKRDQLLLGYLRGTDLRLGDHRDLVKNHGASLRMFQKAMAIEQAWLDALKSGAPLSAAKRGKVQSCASFIKELVLTRGELPPPSLPDTEEGSKRSAQAVKRAKRIVQKLARPADASEWTPERTARHEAMRAAVQAWLSAAEKRLKAEDAYARALKSGGEARSFQAFQASIWEARYAAYAAFANACVEALNPVWLPSPPAFIAQRRVERVGDWRLDPATAALEQAKAAAAVWRNLHMDPNLNMLIKEPYKNDEKFKTAFRDAIAVFGGHSYARVWREAVQKWRSVLEDENADDAQKRAAADAAQTAYEEYRAVRKQDYWLLVDEKYRIPLFMEGEESSMDVETAIYEIAVHKIADSMLIAMDIEHLYEEKIRLGREERAEGALEQLVAVKEWQAALTDGGATEEEARIAQDIAMSYGREHTWAPYWATRHSAIPIPVKYRLEEWDPAEFLTYHPLKFRNDHPMMLPTSASEAEEFNRWLEQERLRRGY